MYLLQIEFPKKEQNAMRKNLSIIAFILMTCFIVACGRGKKASDLTGEEKVHLAEKLIQGTWECKDLDDNSIQRILFEEGHCEFTYIKPDGTKGVPSRGIYTVNEDGMITSINGNESFFMYDIRDDMSMTIAYVPDGGATKGIPDKFEKVD